MLDQRSCREQPPIPGVCLRPPIAKPSRACSIRGNPPIGSSFPVRQNPPTDAAYGSVKRSPDPPASASFGASALRLAHPTKTLAHRDRSLSQNRPKNRSEMARTGRSDPVFNPSSHLQRLRGDGRYLRSHHRCVVVDLFGPANGIRFADVTLRRTDRCVGFVTPRQFVW